MNLQKSRDMSETFNDGICSIHLIDDDGNAGEEIERLRFRERVVGTKRYHEAMTVKMQIDRLIRVPFRPWLTTEYLAVIDGTVYELEQVQMITDSRPKTNDLALHLSRQRRVADGTV